MRKTKLMSGADRRSEVKGERSEGGAFTLDGTERTETTMMQRGLEGTHFPKRPLDYIQGLTHAYYAHIMSIDTRIVCAYFERSEFG